MAHAEKPKGQDGAPVIRIRGEYRGPDGTYRHLKKSIDWAQEYRRLGMDSPGTVLEINTGSPGGWGYSTIMAQVWKRFLTERSKTDLRFRALKEKLDASTPKGIDYIDTTKTLKNLAIAIVEEAKLSDKKCITIAVADESLIKDKNEENPALIHALEKLIGNDMKVEAITVQTLWQKLESDPTRAASMLLFADYTPAELEEACSTSGLDHSAVSSAFNKIATLGPHSIEADTDRDWLISLGLSPDDHELFQEVIAEREIEVAGDTVRHNGTIIDLRKYVLKRMGTFGGKGIFLPDAPNPNERLTSTTVSKLKMEGAKFYLEKHVTGPKTLQPMIITPRPITEPGYAAKPSGYVGEFTVDSRVTFMCDPKGMITPVSLFGRFNYSFRPDNIGSGGGLVPVIIVRDDAYNETIESMGSFLGDLSENDVQEWYSVLERRLGNRGFKVYGNTITFGMMPHIISESAYLSMVSAAKKVGEHILARHSDLKNSFLFAIDTYVDPRPNSERSYENAG